MYSGSGGGGGFGGRWGLVRPVGPVVTGSGNHGKDSLAPTPGRVGG